MNPEIGSRAGWETGHGSGALTGVRGAALGSPVQNWGWAELGSRSWLGWCSHHLPMLVAYPSLPSLLQEMQMKSLGLPSLKPQIKSAFGQKLPVFSHQGWGEAPCRLLSVQDHSPGDPRVPWAPCQGTAPARMAQATCGHSFRNYPSEGRRMRG